MKYRVEWKEIVYDSFDDYENTNEMDDFEVEAQDFDEAKLVSISKAYEIISKNRKDQTRGTFIPAIVKLTDGFNNSVVLIKWFLKLF